MFCQRRQNGNMPVVPDLKQSFHGATKLKNGRRILIMDMILTKLNRSGHIHRISGVFMICMEIFGNGQMIGS